ncbi:hypothetical protein [Sinimarinibacterium flocculans]|uniref:hypothetical protein n=1 Tax=Sinimarinibacterium flocculans TaxID=985250 RepID=UPI0035124F9C
MTEHVEQPDSANAPAIRTDHKAPFGGGTADRPQELSDEAVQNILNLGNVLREVQQELWAIGYRVEDGKLVKHTEV